MGGRGGGGIQGVLGMERGSLEEVLSDNIDVLYQLQQQVVIWLLKILMYIVNGYQRKIKSFSMFVRFCNKVLICSDSMFVLYSMNCAALIFDTGLTVVMSLVVTLGIKLSTEY